MIWIILSFSFGFIAGFFLAIILAAHSVYRAKYLDGAGLE